MGVLIFVKYFKDDLNINLEECVVVLLDYGGVICVCKLVDILKILIVIIDKCCFRLNVVEVMNIVGEIEGCMVIIIDDIIDIVGIIILVV